MHIKPCAYKDAICNEKLQDYISETLLTEYEETSYIGLLQTQGKHPKLW